MLFRILIFLCFFPAIFPTLSAQDDFYIEGEVAAIYAHNGKAFYHVKDENKTPLNGKVRLIAPEKPAYTEIVCDSGYVIAPFRYYQKNILVLEIEFKDGYYAGYRKEFYENGNLKIIGNQTKGVKNGVWEIFNRDGNKISEEVFTEKGKLTRKTIFFPDGGIKEIENRDIDNENIRQRLFYNESGDLIGESNYDGDKLHGKQMKSHKNAGEDYITIRYKTNGIDDGEYKEIYTESGHIKLQGNYLNGEKDGKWIYGDNEGNIYNQKIYNNGELIYPNE